MQGLTLFLCLALFNEVFFFVAVFSLYIYVSSSRECEKKREERMPVCANEKENSHFV